MYVVKVKNKEKLLELNKTLEKAQQLSLEALELSGDEEQHQDIYTSIQDWFDFMLNECE